MLSLDDLVNGKWDSCDNNFNNVHSTCFGDFFNERSDLSYLTNVSDYDLKYDPKGWQDFWISSRISNAMKNALPQMSSYFVIRDWTRNGKADKWKRATYEPGTILCLYRYGERWRGDSPAFTFNKVLPAILFVPSHNEVQGHTLQQPGKIVSRTAETPYEGEIILLNRYGKPDCFRSSCVTNVLQLLKICHLDKGGQKQREGRRLQKRVSRVTQKALGVYMEWLSRRRTAEIFVQEANLMGLQSISHIVVQFLEGDRLKLNIDRTRSYGRSRKSLKRPRKKRPRKRQDALSRTLPARRGRGIKCRQPLERDASVHQDVF